MGDKKKKEISDLLAHTSSSVESVLITGLKLTTPCCTFYFGEIQCFHSCVILRAKWAA